MRNLPNHLRPLREKIFGLAPSHPFDGNAKARLCANAGAHNAHNRHQGPLTEASPGARSVLLWRFHGADGGGRCSRPARCLYRDRDLARFLCDASELLAKSIGKIILARPFNTLTACGLRSYI